MGKKENKLVTYLDGLVVSSHNRRTSIVKTNADIQFHASNIIKFKALTTEVGPLAGARSDVTANGKIKITSLGLSDQGLVDLYFALKVYLKQ